MVRRFIDRVAESRVLDEAWGSGRAELVVVHGRRRVGKTELLARFAAGRRVAFYVAAQQRERDQLADLGGSLGPMAVGFRRGRPPRLALAGWDEVLAMVDEASSRQRVGLVLDEFPYLVDAQPSLPSLLQRWWDSVGSRRDVVVVLSGSEQSMVRHLTSQEGVLYGRPTRSIWLRPFDYYYAGRFVQRWSPEDRIRAFAVAGGIPDYLEELDDNHTLRAEVERLAFSADGRLFREASDLLRSELSEPRTYESILRAIARGESMPSRIADSAGMKSAGAVSPYLERLMELELVERRTLPTEATEPRPRVSRYVLADQYLRFYFALVDPWRSTIQLGQGSRALAELWPTEFDAYVSRVFEDVAGQYLRRLSGAGVLPVLTAVGSAWFAAGDVDVVGAARGRVIAAGSAKWTARPMTRGDLDDLRRDVARVAPGGSPQLMLFSRSGFERGLRRVADARLVRPRDLYATSLEYERSDPRDHSKAPVRSLDAPRRNRPR